ncbi:DUF4357 domain-containing protein [Micromonospora fulviviridis]|uniref:DUF4357 domain-containing protein n=1 Tax=Micromonospora fulviviridis TaxID=47860 RepID=UPI0016630545|nr:DUF4357 domain-containing protein [Micromonospora fulviviridis]
MKQIDVYDDTYDRLRFAAKVFGVSIAEVVERMVQTHDGPQVGAVKPEQPAPPTQTHEVPVHVVYQNIRIQGLFEPDTNLLRITTGDLAGRTYSSPSAAAIAVVEKMNPGRAFPQTNGRTFWVVDSTGKTLRSILGKR